MKHLLYGLSAVLIMIGGLYALSITIDAAQVVKQRFRGPSVDITMPISSIPSAIENAQLQQLCGLGAEPVCTSSTTGDVVMQGGLGLKGSLSLKK